MHFKWKAKVVVVLAPLILHLTQGSEARHSPEADRYRTWRQFGGGSDNIHYSALKQINRANVGKLKVTWTYESGDAFPGSEMQCNPIIIDRTLYATTPSVRVIALDAASGKLRWSFDPNEGKKPLGKMRNRGLAYWESADDKRIFLGFRHWLYALDAKTGQPVTSFGEAGRIDLRDGLGREPATLSVGLTTPGVVY